MPYPEIMITECVPNFHNSAWETKTSEAVASVVKNDVR